MAGGLFSPHDASSPPSNRLALCFKSIVNCLYLLGCAIQVLSGLPHISSSFMPLVPLTHVVFGHDDPTTHRDPHDDNFEDGLQPRPHHHFSYIEERSC